ncbi:hypothetical protein Tco_1421521, partial [Tanacetum coccineum]
VEVKRDGAEAYGGAAGDVDESL